MGGFCTRTNTPFGETPVTTAEKLLPTLFAMATAAMRLFIERSTFLAASSRSVQLLAIAARSLSEYGGGCLPRTALFLRSATPSAKRGGGRAGGGEACAPPSRKPRW